jgi:hypothetical protein
MEKEHGAVAETSQHTLALPIHAAALHGAHKPSNNVYREASRKIPYYERPIVSCGQRLTSRPIHIKRKKTLLMGPWQ